MTPAFAVAIMATWCALLLGYAVVITARDTRRK